MTRRGFSAASLSSKPAEIAAPTYIVTVSTGLVTAAKSGTTLIPSISASFGCTGTTSWP